MQKVVKPWGYEIWFAQTDKYVGKLLYIKKGYRLSLQYHEVKDETLYILSGIVDVTVGNTVKRMTSGEGFRIFSGTKHRMEAIEDATLIEVSTPEIDDVVRLEDDYGRV